MAKVFDTSSFIEHLSELRRRLILIFTINIIGALICYQFIDKLITILLNLNSGMQLIYITPAELFMVYVKLAFICSIVICFPVTAMQIWGFISKGLYKKEKFYGMISLITGALFFLIGTVFSYYTALPMTLNFFMRITIEDITPMISIESYISFCTNLLGCFGLAFELPVVVYLLSELEILKPEFMKRMHGILILIIFIVAAIVTPPDVVSQVILGVPMTILLELSMVICWYVDKRKHKKHKRDISTV